MVSQQRDLDPSQPPTKRIRLGGLAVNPPALRPIDFGYLCGMVSAQMQFLGHIDPALKSFLVQRHQMLQQHIQQHQKNLLSIDQLLQKNAGAADDKVDEAEGNNNIRAADDKVDEAEEEEEDGKIVAEEVGSGEVTEAGGEGGGVAVQGGAPAEAVEEGGEVSGASAGGKDLDHLVSMYCGCDIDMDFDKLAAI